MRYDMADWDEGMEKFMTRLEAGAWRHGIKTEDAMKETARWGKFPADINSMFPRNWKKKNGDMLYLGLYYFVQSELKNAYHFRFGKSGDRYRVRRFYCVPHGLAEDEKDENGNPAKGAKAGLWLRELDLLPPDIVHLAGKYHVRESDSAPVKRFIWTAEDKSFTHTRDTPLADYIDDVLDAM